MAEYDNTNSGMMYRNDRKQEPKHPDFQGFVNVEGVEYWLSGWVKEGRPGSKFDGRKFFSLSLKRKDAPPEDARAQATEAIKGMDDDIPFADPYKGRVCYVV